MTVNPTRRSRIALIAAMLVIIGGVAALVAYALNDDEPQQVAVVPAAAAVQDGADDESEAEVPAPAPDAEAAAEPAVARPAVESFVVDDMAELTCVGEEWEPTQEELDTSRAEADGLAAVLTAAGIDHVIATDPMGFSWVEYDYEDGIAQAVANSYYRDLYPDEWAEPLEGEIFEIPEEDLEFMREENAALTAALDEAGVAYELITDEGGWEWVEWDYEDPAAQEVVDAFYIERYPPEPIPEEELERIREENAGLMAALDEAGVAHELITDEGGWEWVEWDYEDPAAQAAVDAYYAEVFGDDWIGEGEHCVFPEEEWIPTDEDVERAEAEVAEMSAVLEAAGVEFTVVEEGNGLRWVEFDYDDPAAMEAMDAYWMAQSSEWAAEIAADLDRLAAAFDAAGIEYVREGHDECETIIFDTTDAAALAAVASIA
ncbi:MAG: hypothetical protein AAF480_05950 [Actinomycetota bacterium]